MYAKLLCTPCLPPLLCPSCSPALPLPLACKPLVARLPASLPFLSQRQNKEAPAPSAQPQFDRSSSLSRVQRQSAPGTPVAHQGATPGGQGPGAGRGAGIGAGVGVGVGVVVGGLGFTGSAAAPGVGQPPHVELSPASWGRSQTLEARKPAAHRHQQQQHAQHQQMGLTHSASAASSADGSSSGASLSASSARLDRGPSGLGPRGRLGASSSARMNPTVWEDPTNAPGAPPAQRAGVGGPARGGGVGRGDAGEGGGLLRASSVDPSQGDVLREWAGHGDIILSREGPDLRADTLGRVSSGSRGSGAGGGGGKPAVYHSPQGGVGGRSGSGRTGSGRGLEAAASEGGEESARELAPESPSVPQRQWAGPQVLDFSNNAQHQYSDTPGGYSDGAPLGPSSAWAKARTMPGRSKGQPEPSYTMALKDSSGEESFGGKYNMNSTSTNSTNTNSTNMNTPRGRGAPFFAENIPEGEEGRGPVTRGKHCWCPRNGVGGGGPCPLPGEPFWGRYTGGVPARRCVRASRGIHAAGAQAGAGEGAGGAGVPAARGPQRNGRSRPRRTGPDDPTAVGAHEALPGPERRRTAGWPRAVGQKPHRGLAPPPRMGPLESQGMYVYVGTPQAPPPTLPVQTGSQGWEQWGMRGVRRGMTRGVSTHLQTCRALQCPQAVHVVPRTRMLGMAWTAQPLQALGQAPGGTPRTSPGPGPLPQTPLLQMPRGGRGRHRGRGRAG